MIVKLPKEHYAKINTLLIEPQAKNENVLNAVLNSMNRGSVYVDQIEEPRTAIVYAVGLVYYLLGDPENESFNSQLSDFISTQLKQESLDLCGGTWFCSILFNEQWKKTLETVIGRREYYVDYRICYELDAVRFRNSLEQPLHVLDEDLTIVEITKELIIGVEDLREELTEYWSSAESFMQHGIGYAVLKNDKVISTCYSCCVNGDRHEIYIATFDQSVRNRGLATILGQQFIKECLKRGFSVFWQTDESNEPSKRVADKLGFDYTNRLMAFEFEF
ncbi:GNAT family N-acetyltransferase [Aureibacillus halotolerans]|uniref:RimJ/RimL family protein N-acetyltransferase n=1 Tax=Aureibacillus halotolerans TaxID=1508390 RepID=A0A4V3D5E6_9BACI|nr:GNAT family N-acetyltransferase [Aureibacillus halotolerans]TDQ39797.1 RimJ/RimL family protein N-acetyltransferase [Aureibacillus halotolerans]